MGDRLATIDMGRKVGAALPLSVWELGLHLTQCGLGRGHLRTKWHLDPSDCVATIHQRYRHTDRQTNRTTVRWHWANRFTNGRPKTLSGAMLKSFRCHQCICT